MNIIITTVTNIIDRNQITNGNNQIKPNIK